jgi:hypothetical protein
LVYEGKEENLLKLDDLVRDNPSILPFACYFAIKFFEQRDRIDEAKIYRYRLDDWEYKSQAAEEEREYIYENDNLQYHNMHKQHIRVILDILREQKSVKKAWLVRKEIGYLKNTPFFPLVIKRGAFSFADKRKIEQNIITSLEKQGLSRYCRPFWIDEYNGLNKKLKKMPESVIYK